MDMKDLFEKYFEGLTSLEEEKRLRDMFRRNEVPDEYMDYAPFFAYVEEESKSFQEVESVRPKFSVPKWTLAISTAAAVLLTIFLVMPNKEDGGTYVAINGEKIYDEEIAMEYALDRLSKISHQLSSVKEYLNAPADMKKEVDDAMSKVGKHKILENFTK